MDYQSHQTEDNTIKINFASKSVHANMVLGADGINSKVRNQVVTNSTLRNSGQICWRGISNFELPSKLKNKGRECWGRNIRFGFSEIGPNEVYWFAVALQNQHPEVSDKEELATIFKNFDPIVSNIIRNTSNWNIANLKDLKRLPKWHHDRVCLIGDAAHATTPNMGQGACQGIEDAYYISNILHNTSSIDETFKTFESERRKKTDYIVNTSWTFGKMAHSTLGQSLLKLMMKIIPESVMNKQMNKVYEIKSF